jgi:myo-inositol 2-dehydrogenase/D-chiro-inositol 1-dehydrogenase
VLHEHAGVSSGDSRSGLPRLVVWGLGRMGLRHAENVQRSAYAQLAGVADIDPERAGFAASKLQTVACGELQEALERLSPDGVVIATHASNHAEAIEIAARHGVHVFCEKPLAFDGPTAARVLEGAQAAGVYVQMGFQMRFDEDLGRLAAEVQAGALGRIFQLRSTVRDAVSPTRDYLESSGGYYRDTAPHCLDYGRWLLGEVDEVTAAGVALSDPMYEELGDVDNAAILVHYTAGTLGTINLSRVDGYGFDTAVEVLGERGAIRVPGGKADGLERYEPGRVAWTHVQDFLERFARAYVSELDAFAQLIAGEIQQTAATGLDGLATMRIAEAAVMSHERRAAVKVAEVPW